MSDQAQIEMVEDEWLHSREHGQGGRQVFGLRLRWSRWEECLCSNRYSRGKWLHLNGHSQGGTQTSRFE